MATHLVDLLWQASVQGAVAAACVWGCCRIVPSLPASVRTLLWWLVAAKLLVGLAWTAPVRVPVLRASQLPSVAAASAQAVADGAPDVAPPRTTLRIPPRLVASEQVAAPPARTWRVPVALSWVAGLVVILASMVRRHRGSLRLLSHASEAPPAVIDAATSLARRLGVATPRIVVSDEAVSPMVCAPWRPTVVLPRARFDALDPVAQRMVLCHELVHVRRHDLWAGCVPDLAARVFFFHPLAHLAAREYRLAREAACDAEVLQTLGAEPRDYGRLLLTLGVVRREPALAATGASRSFSDMKRRLQMLNHVDPSPRMRRLGTFVLGAAVLALVPIQLVARPPVAPPGARAGDVALAGAAVQALPEAPFVGGPQSPATSAGAAAGAGRAHAGHDAQEATRHVARRGFEWLLLKADGDTMSGTHGERARARALQRNGEPLLWARLEGQEYVVRDRQLVREAEALFDETEALGKRMGEIGAQQGTLGAKQAQVGARQAAIGAKQAALGAEIGALAQKQVALAMERVSRSFARAGSQAPSRDSASDQHLEQRMKELSAQIEALSAQLEEMTKPLEEFGRQMEPFAAQLSQMGKQIEAEVAKAEAALRALVERAIKDGKAEAVK